MMRALDKRLRELLGVDMVITVMPAVQAAIQSAARDLAMEAGGENDPFVLDEMAQHVIHQVCEFLLQCNLEDGDFVHFRQLTDDYYHVFWGVKKDDPKPQTDKPE
jgi:hypothetical protein